MTAHFAGCGVGAVVGGSSDHLTRGTAVCLLSGTQLHGSRHTHLHACGECSESSFCWLTAQRRKSHVTVARGEPHASREPSLARSWKYLHKHCVRQPAPHQLARFVCNASADDPIIKAATPTWGGGTKRIRRSLYFYSPHSSRDTAVVTFVNTLRTGSFKLFKLFIRPFPGF